MTRSLDRQELLRFARAGAKARLEALERERAQLLKTFPGLAAPDTVSRSEKTSLDASRRRRRMTAAQRKAVSIRMRRYWAERRKANAKHA